MSTFSDAIDGLATVLKNGIAGLHTYNHPPDAVQELPAVVMIVENVDPEMAFGGNSIMADIRCVFLYHSGVSDEAFRQIYDAIDPTNATTSVIKAIRDDSSLDAKVDSSRIVAIENIGRREIGGGFLAGFDVVVRFVKTVG